MEKPIALVQEDGVVAAFGLPTTGEAKTPVETPRKTREKTNVAILRLLRKQPDSNIAELARSFADLLEQTIRRYQNRAIEAAQVIKELIQLAREMREANARGESLGLSEDELAFYDALEANDSAVKVLGEPTLRMLVKRILRRYGYPPDKQEHATQLVLEQAALLSETWAA